MTSPSLKTRAQKWVIRPIDGYVLALFDDRPFRLRDRVRYVALRAGQWSGATPRQVRYWDQIGLVKPSIQQTGGRPGRQRLYSADDVWRLRMVVVMLHEGLSIQAIRYLVSKGLTFEQILAGRRRKEL